MTDQDIIQEAKEVVSSFREFEGKRKEFSELVNNWDLMVSFWKQSKGPNPQQTKRTLTKDLRKAEARFWSAIRTLERAITLLKT